MKRTLRCAIKEKDVKEVAKNVKMSQVGRLKPSPVVYQGICMNFGYYDQCEREVWSKYEKTKRCGECLRNDVTVAWNKKLRLRSGS